MLELVTADPEDNAAAEESKATPEVWIFVFVY